MFLDTSIVLDIFKHDREEEKLNRILSRVSTEVLYISMVQLAEVADICIRTEISAEVDQPVGDAAFEAFGWDQLRHKTTGLIGPDRTSTLERAVLALEDGSVDTLIESLEEV